MSEEKLLQQANNCIENRENIPGSPLWHMGKVGAFGSKDSFELLQNTIDYLTCKAKAAKPFTEDEKEFMKELYESFWWGSKYKMYFEAGKLADHYVNGKGKPLNIDSKVYTSSVIVSDTMSAMKKFIKDQATKKQPFAALKSNTPSFLTSAYARKLNSAFRNANTEGYMKQGVLLAEQSNQRLKKADHQFYLTVNTTLQRAGFISNWRVDSFYDFESFADNEHHVTDLRLKGEYVLKLPDGLSQYIAEIGVAHEFKYSSAWSEVWK